MTPDLIYIAILLDLIVRDGIFLWIVFVSFILYFHLFYVHVVGQQSFI